MAARMLVGRERELEALDEAIRAALRGERAVLMLSGEPGIGKTRLLEEIATRFIGEGGIVAWGRMWEVGVTPPFLPWMQLLASLETREDRAPDLEQWQAQALGASRFARFRDVSAFLNRRASAAPIAVLFDDLHAADPSSLELLEYVLRELLGKRVLVALAARAGDASLEVEACLSRIQRSARRLVLAPLSRDSVTALVGARGDAHRVFELSEGNPLFVEELLAQVGSGGDLALPRLSSVREVIRARTARLPERTRALLQAASVLGRDFRGQVAADAARDSDAANALEPAIALGIVTLTGSDRYRFSHALVAEAIADDLSANESARLHARTAEAIARCDPGNLTAIAHHLLAGPPCEAAIRAAEEAAAQSIARLAFEDAAALLGRALQTQAAIAPADTCGTARLLCARAEALQHALRHDEAATLCDRATELLRPLLPRSAPIASAPAVSGVAELFAHIALVHGLEFRFGRTNPRLVALLEEALAVLGSEPLTLRAKLLARLAAAEQPSTHPEEPVAQALEAIELARRLDPRTRLEVMYVATAALVDYVEVDTLEHLHREVLELARGQDRWIVVHTLFRLCFTALQRLDRRETDCAIQTFGAEAQALGLPRWTRQIHMLSAMIALLEGRFRDAECSANDFETISESLGDVGARWLLNVHRAMVAWTRCAPQDEKQNQVLLDYPPGRAAIAAWFALQRGDRDAARTALAELRERIPADPDLCSMVANAAAFVRDRDLVERLYAALAPRSGQMVIASTVGSAVFELYDRVLLLLASASERWPLIDTYAERALAVAAKLGSPVWDARIRADWADALVARGAASDLDQASELRARALATARRFEMPGLIERCSAAPAGTAANGTVHCIRSGDLWVVTGLGELAHVKDSRGVQMIARLVQEPGTPFHVLDLAGNSEVVDAGDAGPALDETARVAYRRRLAELVAEREEASSNNDPGRLERANAEIEALTAELERAFGLGGRARRIGAASERARSNVQRRITHGIDQIRAANPALGEHLAKRLRTGTYCVYSSS